MLEKYKKNLISHAKATKRELATHQPEKQSYIHIYDQKSNTPTPDHRRC